MTTTTSAVGDLRLKVIAEFERRFGGPPTIVARAPGRVNLIGDHTDYNDGFVLPMAIDRAVYVALRPNRGKTVRVFSLDFDEHAEFDPSALSQHEGSREGGWSEYVRGIGWSLATAGLPVQTWDGVVAGDVPLGAGLSSSAAMEVATARAFTAVSSVDWNAPVMARLAQQAENQWVGVNCGIMDQLISAAGTAGHALLIDCRSLATQAVPVPMDAAVVVLDTATRRGLVDSLYNERRAQCEAAARFFRVKSLRDVDIATFTRREHALDAVTRRRARHVLTENARTLSAAEALRSGNLRAMGRLMSESHISLRDDFEVSRHELDVMVREADAYPGCHGARMTGAGFGGCAVALVSDSAVTGFVETVAGRYKSETGLEPAVYVCHASQGASIEKLVS